MSSKSCHDVEDPPTSTSKSMLDDMIDHEELSDEKRSTHHAMERRMGEPNAYSLSSANTSLTVFARHKIQPGKQQQFEGWIRDISKLQKEKYPGFEGAQVVRPTCLDAKDEYLSIFRYQNYDLLQAFMNSDDRRRFLEMTHEFAAAPIDYTYHSLEFLFVDEATTTPGLSSGKELSNVSRRPPSKSKMVVVTFLLIWIQSHFIGPALDRLFPDFPSLALEALTIFLIVLGTTFIWMPIVTKYILHWWLFPT